MFKTFNVPSYVLGVGFTGLFLSNDPGSEFLSVLAIVASFIVLILEGQK